MQIIFWFFLNFFCCLFLRQHEDDDGAVEHFSCCHCNVNSLAAYNYKKVSLVEAYNAIHHCDLICVSETYLDSSTANDGKDISIKGYSVVRADHPTNTKQGGVCIYYKESLSVRIIDISNLTESILCQITINKKRVMFL